MSRYKDYREPRRRGYDDDYTPPDRSPEPRPDTRRPSMQQAGEPVEATVKWFNSDKGFGFVAVVGGPEAFLHVRQVEAAGHTNLPEGARLKVRIGEGQKGPQVTEVLEVDTSTASPSSGMDRRPAAPSGARRPPPTGATEEVVGTVKFYNAAKGFGFVGQDGGEQDVFVHATALERSGLVSLTEGQRVKMDVSRGQKGLEARSIKMLD